VEKTGSVLKGSIDNTKFVCNIALVRISPKFNFVVDKIINEGLKSKVGFINITDGVYAVK